MAAGGVHTKSLCCIFMLLLVSNVLLNCMLEVEARPLHGSRLRGDAIEGTKGRFSLWMNKKSGPSPGIGHKYENVKTQGGVTDSGPSPGIGHKYENVKTQGGATNSGTSPGIGHKYKNVKILAVVKNFGPSPNDGHH